MSKKRKYKIILLVFIILFCGILFIFSKPKSNTSDTEKQPIISSPEYNLIIFKDLLTSAGELDITKILQLQRAELSQLSQFKLEDKGGKPSDTYTTTLETGTMYSISFILGKTYPSLFDIYAYKKLNYCKNDFNGEEFSKELNIPDNPNLTKGMACNEINDITKIDKDKYPFIHLYLDGK